MSQTTARNLANPAQSEPFVANLPSVGGRPGTYYQQQRQASSQAQAQESWTPYDGVPEGPRADRGMRQNRMFNTNTNNKSRNFGGSWRSGATSDARSNTVQPLSAPSMVPPITHGDRYNVSSPPPKRSKMPSDFGGSRQGNRRQEFRQDARISRPQKQIKGQQNMSGRNRAHVPFSGEIYDADALRAKYGEIKPEDYPGAPEKLFSNPKAFLWDSKGINGRSTFLIARQGMFRCNVFLTFPDFEIGKLDALGDGVTKKEAERNACHHAILKLHEAGALKELTTSAPGITSFDPNLIKDEADAKLDIYDYCARFDTIPNFEVREARMRGRAVVECVVQLPSQNINAIARAKDRRTAEILASVEFKRQAQEWHAKNGDEDIIIKDAGSLNSRNAKKFFEFLKMENKNTVYNVVARQPRGLNKRLYGSTTQAQFMLNEEPFGPLVEMQNKRLGETAAYLMGAIELKKQQPELFNDFVEALKRGNGELLKPIAPTWLNVDQDCLLSMTDTILKCRKVGMGNLEEPIEQAEEMKKAYSSRRQLHPQMIERKNIELQEAMKQFEEDPTLEKLRRLKSELPMNQYREQVLKIVEGAPVSIIVGATGSGKTTQVPQILLEKAIAEGKGAECNIICTQPRRIAATSVAQRVAVERNEPLQKTVGYHVRFDAKNPAPGGSITYCTTGILLQQLRNHPEEALTGVTHLIIDEVHERDILIDLLLVILKRIMVSRRKMNLPEIKVVLMSATMDTELFANYFKQKDEQGNSTETPFLSVPGRTFPVKDHFLGDIQEQLRASYPAQDINRLLMEKDTREYLEVESKFVPTSRPISTVNSEVAEEDDDGEAIINWKAETTFTADGAASIQTEKEDALIPVGLIAATVAHIARTTTDGAILVFLPGLQEITTVDEFLRTQRPLGIDFSDSSKYKMNMLHSSIPTVQNEIFGEVPTGCRKIILSTNIAETSVTIPDVQYVVDTGKHREKQYEQARRITRLACTWISKSNSKQRAGRAGRVQDGNYYALFSNTRFNSLRAAGLPEMLRSDLQEICLDIKAQGFTDPVARFLSEAIEPPTPAAIESSLEQLRTLNALDENEKLTPLGRVLATLPVEPALGKMILLGVIFRCLDPMLILGALASTRDIFVSPLQLRKESEKVKLSFTRGTQSDHMAYLNAFREWREIRDREGQYAAHRFSENNFLHRGALKTIDQTAAQIEDILVESRLIPRTRPSDRFRSELGHPALNDNASSVPLIKALTLAGMYPNLAFAAGGRGWRTANENFTMIHPNSVNYSKKPEELFPYGSLLTFSTKAKSNDGTSILLRSTTEVTALSALMFGGKLKTIGNLLQIDGWMPFQASQSVMKVTWEFRKALDRLLTIAFQDLAKSGTNRCSFLADHPARETFARGLVEILDRDVKRRDFGNRSNSGRGGMGGGSDRWRPNPVNVSDHIDRYIPDREQSPPRLSGTGRPGGGIGNVVWR